MNASELISKLYDLANKYGDEVPDSDEMGVSFWQGKVEGILESIDLIKNEMLEEDK